MSQEARQKLRAAALGQPSTNGGPPAAYACTIDEKGRLQLPPVPDPPEPAELCAWATGVFTLNPKHPIIEGRRLGAWGPDGHVVFKRRGAREIRIEPVSRLTNPTRLREALCGFRERFDDQVHGFKGEHTYVIEHVVRMLCDYTEVKTAADNALAVIGTFLAYAEPAEHDGRLTTRGTSAQRYEAAIALRRATNPSTGRRDGPPRYFTDTEIDKQTGEIKSTGHLVVAVSDMANAAREHERTTIPRGELEARMEGIGWKRITLDGHEESGRAGRHSPHARIEAYRGRLPNAETGANDAPE